MNASRALRSRQLSVFSTFLFPSQTCIRYASLTSAIDRGRRREDNGTVRAPGAVRMNMNNLDAIFKPKEQPGKKGQSGKRYDNGRGGRGRSGKDSRGSNKVQQGRGRSSAGRTVNVPDFSLWDRDAPGKDAASPMQQSPYGSTISQRTTDRSDRRDRSEQTDEPSQRTAGRPSFDTPRQPKDGDGYPLSVPYTAADSEFIYGFAPVLNAMQSNQRKMHKLYLTRRGPTETSPDVKRRKQVQSLFVVAKDLNVPIHFVSDPESARLMDKMSAGRPHNGFVLEASPLKTTAAAGLKAVSSKDDKEFRVANKSDFMMPLSSFQPGIRFPLVLYLDGVLDPGNLGNMIRTAHFLGVDAVVLGTSTCTLTPIVLKASAGAAERMQFVSVIQGSKFLQDSQAAGWSIVAAVAPDSDSDKRGRSNKSPPSILSLSALRERNILGNSPVILLIGSEGDGIHRSLQGLANYKVGISSPRYGKSRQAGIDSESEIDSLNVNVASSLMMEALLVNRELEKEVQAQTQAEEAENKLWVEEEEKSAAVHM